MKEEIKSRIKILDLVYEFGLRVYRKNFIKSIYNDERTPSLKIYADTNTYKCYSTGIQGDVIKFYMDYHQIDFKEALKELAEKAGLDYKSSEKLEVRSKKRMKPKRIEKQVAILKSEKEYFDEKAGVLEYSMGLERSKSELLAMGELMNERKEIQLLVFDSFEKFCFGLDDESFDYLIGKERGLKPETIKRFRLFTIKDQKLTFEFLQDCFTKDQLLIAGMINKKGNLVFAFHRLIIPYIEKNKITYLRGRIIGTNERLSKYISLTNYSGNLTLKRFFNMDVLNKIRPDEKLFICEGEFDTMILEQEGYKSIGVPGVTNIPVDKIDLIRNYDLYLAFDNDEAGDLAMHKMTNLLNRPIKAIKLKHHNDITELINERNNRTDF
ncbi:MAG: CHC2 zinc finger domain-containing protein [Ignavibacteria bacterium]|nr:CHC2 zinc finger domain-containing protein [Ignavibacteria bacterium]